ncbi:MAG: FAD-binding protein [Candidatus Latescibacteria bacterium]|nr:FAD-binding protein [Candidatus Latescibacterota bacterium]
MADLERDTLDQGQRTELAAALATQLDGQVRFDPVSRSMYATDASVYQIEPMGVVTPRHAEDVVQLVRICVEHGASITARGGGTSQAGQAIGPGVQVDFSRHMNRLLKLDTQAMTVQVEPGIVLDELNAQLKPHGLQLPLDLSTSSRATIGGMIANNSAGTRSVVYGKTIDYVLGLRAVLSDGSQVEIESLESGEWQRRCGQDDLEGACYRVVSQLAGEHRAEIERRYPKILRRVGGYNLDEFTALDRPFNLARIMVGSEGTLGMTTAATLRLVPLPRQQVVCSVQFADILEAMAATPLILKHGPTAVELVDRFILQTTKGRTEFEPLRDFIDGDPGAVLIVEFAGEEAGQLPDRIDALAADLQRAGLGHHVHRALEPGGQKRIWDLRKAALGLSMSQRGDAKSISFVEDTAVAPQHLRAYIERFQAILARHQIEAGFYAHASVGLLHIRPVIDMKTADGVEKFARIAEEVANLVLEYGGALSGEHGDGLARAPFQEKMFGSVLYGAFCRLKDTFDPVGLFNPGKIVRAPPLTANLRFGPDYVTPPVDSAFAFADFGGLVQATEQCSGVGACRKRLTGTMCPSYMATREEGDTTRGRANALRLALTGKLGLQGLTDERLYPVFDLCLECKACKSECPTGVDMARLKSEFLHQYQHRHGSTRRARFLARTERLAHWGSRLAPLSNWLAGGASGRWLAEKIWNLDRHRAPPPFARRSFLQWWVENGAQYRVGSAASQVVLFADTFTNYHEPQHAQAALRLAQRLGVGVEVAPRVCCGRPLISKGFLDQAAQQARETTRALAPLARADQPILFCEPSCYSAVRDDHPHLLEGAEKAAAEEVAAACLTVEEWAVQVMEEGAGSDFLRPGPERILVHGHCHQKALVGMQPTLRMLAAVPGAEVVALDSGCCGMAGSFGYEREHSGVSRTMGEHRLFPAVRELGDGAAVVAPGFSCRHQIAHGTGVQAQSPVGLVADLLNPVVE